MSAHALAAYLNSLPRTIARPVVVKIGRVTYEGASFNQTRDHHPGTRAYDDAIKAGASLTYAHRGFKLLGQLPASYGRASYVQEMTGSVRALAESVRYYIGGWWNTTPETFEPRAYMRESDGSTRPQTFADVAEYHYADGTVPYFNLYVDESGSTALGERGGLKREMRITIDRLPAGDRFVNVPAPYIGQPDATLVLETDNGERGDMTLYVAGRVVARGEGFGAAQVGPSLLEMESGELAEMFGAFLSHALESGEDDARAGWSVLTDDASEWCDALSMMEEEVTTD